MILSIMLLGGQWYHINYPPTFLNSMETLEKTHQLMLWLTIYGVHQIPQMMILFDYIFSRERSQVQQLNGTLNYLELDLTISLPWLLYFWPISSYRSNTKLERNSWPTSNRVMLLTFQIIFMSGVVIDEWLRHLFPIISLLNGSSNPYYHL